jgi:hypothetical protein
MPHGMPSDRAYDICRSTTGWLVCSSRLPPARASPATASDTRTSCRQASADVLAEAVARQQVAAGRDCVRSHCGPRLRSRTLDPCCACCTVSIRLISEIVDRARCRSRLPRNSVSASASACVLRPAVIARRRRFSLFACGTAARVLRDKSSGRDEMGRPLANPYGTGTGGARGRGRSGDADQGRVLRCWLFLLRWRVGRGGLRGCRPGQIRCRRGYLFGLFRLFCLAIAAQLTLCHGVSPITSTAEAAAL